jgi:hypothetical protein
MRNAKQGLLHAFPSILPIQPVKELSTWVAVRVQDFLATGVAQYLSLAPSILQPTAYSLVLGCFGECNKSPDPNHSFRNHSDDNSIKILIVLIVKLSSFVYHQVGCHEARTCDLPVTSLQ